MRRGYSPFLHAHAFSASEKRQLEEFISIYAGFIAAFEQKTFLKQVKPLKGTEILAFLMEQHGLTQKEVAKELGGQSVVSELLSHKRALNTRQIEALSSRFGVAREVFF